jgi:hypothetical protein
MLMLIDCKWTRKCQDLALQQSLSTQRWFTGQPKHTSTALAVEQGMPSCTAESSNPGRHV